MGEAKRLGTAGFCAIAVGFGPARAGYGLFLPDFRDEFGLSIGLSGLVASGLQAGYLVALTLVGLLVARVGPRPFVVVGMSAAGLGMVLVALVPGAILLAVWSSIVFAETPSTGFSATLFLFGFGCVAGPAALGATAGRFGLETAFGISAVIIGLTAAAALLPVGEKARGEARTVEDR